MLSIITQFTLTASTVLGTIYSFNGTNYSFSGYTVCSMCVYTPFVY